jgi:hypothetical protein
MTTIQDMISRVQDLRLQLPDMVNNAIIQEQDWITEYQKAQLYDGKNSEGNDITPSYLDDPYFKTRKQAIAYARFKQKISPNPVRNFYTPNLYINGFFYSNLYVKVNGQSIEFDDSADFSPAVEEKYQKKLLGLNPESWYKFTYGPFWSVLAPQIENILDLKFSNND